MLTGHPLSNAVPSPRSPGSTVLATQVYQAMKRRTKLAGDAQIETNQVLYDPQAVIKIVESSISDSRDDSTSSSHTLLSLIESGVMRGDGAKSKLRGPTRRRTNQLLMNTVSAQTLKWSLGWRTEQLWGCPTCRDVNS